MQANQQDPKFADVQKQEEEEEQKKSHDSSFDKLNRSRSSLYQDTPRIQQSSQKFKRKKTNQPRVIHVPHQMKEKVHQINKLSCMVRFVDAVRLVTAIPTVVLFINTFVTSAVFTINYEQDSGFKALKYYNRIAYPIRFSTTLNLLLTVLYFPILGDMVKNKGWCLNIWSILLFDLHILGLLLHGMFFFIAREVTYDELTSSGKYGGAYNLVLANLIIYCIVFCGEFVGVLVFVILGGRFKQKKINSLIRVLSIRQEEKELRDQEYQNKELDRGNSRNNSISEFREKNPQMIESVGKGAMDRTGLQTTIQNVESVPKLKKPPRIHPEEAQL